MSTHKSRRSQGVQVDVDVQMFMAWKIESL